MNNIKKLAKFIRVITVAPIMAFILINLLFFFSKESIGLINYFIAIFSLVVFPLLAYPVQDYFTIIPGEKRKAQRTLAIIFSIIAYIVGLFLAIILKASSIEKIMFLTYLLSGVLIAVFSFGLKINGSGHMCGLAGPIALIVYVFGPTYIVLVFLLLFVLWASLYLKRHSLIELIIGSIIPIIALIISVIIFK